MLFGTFQKVLSKKAKNTLFIWTTALPVSKDVRGGVILQEINFLAEILRYDVLLANQLSSRLAAHYGFDVLDLHHAMRRHIPWRLPDGIHWNAVAHRKITGMLLHHICAAWHVQLPARIATRYTISGMPTLQTGRITGYGNSLTSGSEDEEAQSTSSRAAASRAEGSSAPVAEMVSVHVCVATVSFCFLFHWGHCNGSASLDGPVYALSAVMLSCNRFMMNKCNDDDDDDVCGTIAA